MAYEGDEVMDREVINYIDKLAERIIEAYSIDIPIMDMEEVVNNMGGKVLEVGDICDEGVVKNEDGSFELRVDIGFSSSEKDIAFQLGHLFLHAGYRTCLDAWENFSTGKAVRFSSEAAEQAQYFAHALMMPKSMFLTACDKYSCDKVVYTDKVAKHFNVKPNDVCYRGIVLGNLED